MDEPGWTIMEMLAFVLWTVYLIAIGFVFGAWWLFAALSGLL